MKKTTFLKLLPLAVLAMACGRSQLGTAELETIQTEVQQKLTCKQVELIDQTDAAIPSLLVIIGAEMPAPENGAEEVLRIVENHFTTGQLPDELIVRFEDNGYSEDFTFDLGTPSMDISNTQSADVLSVSQLMH